MSDYPTDPQPKKALPDHIERFLDLSATEEDHGEVSWTMPSGAITAPDTRVVWNTAGCDHAGW